MIVIIDALTDVAVAEGVVDIVMDHIDSLDDLNVTEILADIRREGMERVASTGNLDAVAILLVKEAEFAFADVIVDIIIGSAVHNLAELVVSSRAVERQACQDTHNAGGVLCRRVRQVLRCRLRVNLGLITASSRYGIRISRIDAADVVRRAVDDTLIVGVKVRDDSLEALVLERALALDPCSEIFLILCRAGRMADVIPLDVGHLLEDVCLIQQRRAI